MAKNEEKKSQKQDKKDHKKDEDSSEIESLKDTIRRVQAEFENYKKRVERENEEFRKFASKSTIVDVLPMIDNLGLALKNTSNPEEFVKGIEMIYAQLLTFLEKYGVQKIDCEGMKFDPYLHEAMMAGDCEKESDGCVLEEFQCGYKMGDKVIRHAKVKIGKHDPESEGKDE